MRSFRDMDDNNYYVFVFCVPHNIMYGKCVCVRMSAFVRACVCVCVRVHMCVHVCVCVTGIWKARSMLQPSPQTAAKVRARRFGSWNTCSVASPSNSTLEAASSCISPRLRSAFYSFVNPLPQLTSSLHLHQVSHLFCLSLSHQYAVLFAVAISSFGGTLGKAAVWSLLLRFVSISCTWVPAGNLACSTLMPYPEIAWPQHSFRQGIRQNCCLISVTAVHLN